jgi:UDP-galactopyranose mutase
LTAAQHDPEYETCERSDEKQFLHKPYSFVGVYQYLVVGSGLFGSVFARTLADAGAKVLVIEKRPHIGGNVYTLDDHKHPVHVYGPHAFHTSCRRIWDYINRFAEFNNYRHRVRACFQGKIYSLPFNMNTFHQLWGVMTPEEARCEIDCRRIPIEKPANLEEWAVSHVGEEVYQKLIYGYTKKQWQRDPKSLPASILRRLPLRFTWNDDYHDDPYQGVPIHGYTSMIRRMLEGIEVKTDVNFFHFGDWRKTAKKLVYSGSLDEFFDYRHGPLEYRSLEFKFKTVDGDFQGCTQMNFTDESVPYTRIVESNHFYSPVEHTETSTISYEFPKEWVPGEARYYPINDAKNMAVYGKYVEELKSHGDVLVGGRLGKFAYYDMDQVVAQALMVAEREISTF